MDICPEGLDYNYAKFAIATGGRFTLTPSPGVGVIFSANIVVSDISLKLDSVGYISVAVSIGVSSTTFT